MGGDRPPAAQLDAPADQHCEIPGAATEGPTPRSTTPAPARHRTARPRPVAPLHGTGRSPPGTRLRRRRSLGWPFGRATDVVRLENPAPAGRADWPAFDPNRTPQH